MTNSILLHSVNTWWSYRPETTDSFRTFSQIFSTLKYQLVKIDENVKLILPTTKWYQSTSNGINSTTELCINQACPTSVLIGCWHTAKSQLNLMIRDQQKPINQLSVEISCAKAREALTSAGLWTCLVSIDICFIYKAC